MQIFEVCLTEILQLSWAKTVTCRCWIIWRAIIEIDISMKTVFKPMLNYCFVCFCAIMLFVHESSGQNIATKHVYLKQASYDALPNAAKWLTDLSEDKSVIPRQVIILFRGYIPEIKRIGLQKSGIYIHDYIGDNAYSALVIPTPSLRNFDATDIYNITDIKPEWKADAALWRKVNNSKTKEYIIISFLNGVSSNDISTMLLSTGAEIKLCGLEKLNVYKLTAPSDKIMEIAEWYGTQYISSASLDIPLDAEANATQKSIVATTPVYIGGYGLTGDSVTVGVGDNTSGIFHIDMKDRIINYNPAPYNYHGVHTSGTVGGAGIIDPKGEGVATHTTIVNHLYSNIWEQTDNLFQSHNMTITNNSYAASNGNCSYAGTYDVNSQALDKVCLKYKSVIHVFAAGNDGLLSCSPFPPAYSTISGGYQPAKNILVVSSVDKHYKNEKVTGSRGPVKDGRLRPDMVAVGADVNAPTNTEEYLVTLGTSMASPQVAGGLALLTERYKKKFGNVLPASDLMKALMMNGATDVGNSGPDFTNGYGVMNVDRSLEILNNAQYYTNAIANAGTQTINIPVTNNIAELKVMLYWHDVAASPLSSTQLVNDLDIEVIEPGSIVHKPLILDPTPANVTNNAVEGVDRLNNCEQVVIKNPASGYYTITVKGFNIPSGQQDYVVTYDLIPVGVKLTNPVTGSRVKAGDSLLVYWDASNDNNSFLLEYSVNNGANWVTIDNNIPADKRYYTWQVPSSINSGNCLMRITRNATTQSSTTGKFVINMQPVVVLSSTQCPGYMKIDWVTIPNATSYVVMKKSGPFMVPVDTVSSPTYTFSGLSLDSIYYAAVTPVIDGLTGYRSLAVKRQPDDGDCFGNISDGDLMIQNIVSPVSGRAFTSTALSNNETLRVLVRNLDNAPANNYIMSINVNGVWTSVPMTTTIPENDTMTLAFPGLNLAANGSYTIQAAITNVGLTDNVTTNDTATKTVLSVANAPMDISIAFLDDFEDLDSVQYYHDFFGMTSNGHWDYVNSTDTGRIRSVVNSSITLNGKRSISMDVYQYMVGNRNDFIGTFNLKDYDVTKDEVRLEFSYMLHGKPTFKNGNNVSLRENDTDPRWSILYHYDTSYINLGELRNSGSLSITDALMKGGKNFSTSVQLMFSQNDNSVISLRNFGKGLTIDDIKLYTVKNDVQITNVINPKNVECGLIGLIPLTINVYNSVFQPQNNVQLYYQLDGGIVVNESLPHIDGKDTVSFTFTQKMDIGKQGLHTLNVWLEANGDTYHPNDSIMNYMFHNEPLISIYPYVENFEAGDGYWYSDGQRNSWEFGTPASVKIKNANSGSKAWKTNLDGLYNNLETSYLYSPCFNLLPLLNPRLKFKTAMDIENCGQELCDRVYMEYSLDGSLWKKLGNAGEGTGWYNDTVHNVWSVEDNTNWHESSIGLPKEVSSLRLRFVFQSDPGLTKEGIAVDDIEVYDDLLTPITNQIVSISPNPTQDGQITIEWIANTGTEMNILMTDISGRDVFRYSTKAIGAKNKTVIQTPKFASGVYPARIIIGDKRFERKIVYY